MAKKRKATASQTALWDTEWARLRARLAEDVQHLLDRRESLHGELQDPHQAWEAYLLARLERVDVPGWVSSYLDRVARRMTARSLAISEGKKPAGTLEQALELDGHGAGAVSAKRTALWRRQQYVVDVHEVMAKGYTQSNAISGLLEAYSSRDRATDARTIERALSEYKRKGWRGAPQWPSETARQIRGPNLPRQNRGSILP